MNRLRSRFFSPALATFVILSFYLGVVFVQGDFDPMVFVRIGEKYQTEDALDPEGYDGQFVYFIARDMKPERVADMLDVPAYRYQRILMPLIARIFSFGNTAAIPWVLIGIGIISHLLGVSLVAQLLEARGANRWYALVYGLWVGFLLAVRLDLPEPLAFFFVAAGIVAGRQRPFFQWALFGVAVFTKEVVLLFVVGKLIHDVLQKNWAGAAGLVMFSITPFLVFQVWIFQQFGAFGISSGGAMATGFEWIPFMGWFRIGAFSWLYFAVYGLIVVPFFYLPALWSLRKTIPRLLRSPRPETTMLLMNAVVIPFLPFSTVRETGGLFRFGCGLILAFLLFASAENQKKALRYSPLWLSLSAIIINA